MTSLAYPSGLHPHDAARLMDSFERDPDGCWIWRRAFTTAGYGHFHAAGRYYQAHRLMYGLLVGVVPAELTIDHLCRNRACVNPAHMDPVTSAVNTRRGTRTYLDERLVAEIRRRHAEGETMRGLARGFGINHSTVSRLLRGVTWRNAA